MKIKKTPVKKLAVPVRALSSAQYTRTTAPYSSRALARVDK